MSRGRGEKEVPYKLNSGHVPRCSQEVECLVLHKKARDSGVVCDLVGDT